MNIKGNYSAISKADRMHCVQIELLCNTQQHKEICHYMVEEIIVIDLNEVFHSFKAFKSELFIL